MSVGHQILHHRQARGWSQEKLAEKSGITPLLLFSNQHLFRQRKFLTKLVELKGPGYIVARFLSGKAGYDGSMTP